MAYTTNTNFHAWAGGETMKTFTVCTAQGQIVQSGSLPESDISRLIPPEGGRVIIGSEYTVDSPVYFDEGTASFLPKKDSPGDTFVFDFEKKGWKDLRTLQSVKATQRAAINKAKATAELSGFNWKGFVFDSDEISQNRLQRAVIASSGSDDFTVDWVLKDNTVVSLTGTELLLVLRAMTYYSTLLVQKATRLKKQIEASSDIASVEAITWGN